MTEQIKDICHYLGNEYHMSVCLPLPVDNLSIIELTCEEFSAEDFDGVYTSTACWRNYVATWAVKEQRLVLVQLKGKYRLVRDRPLLAEWFTGEFELPQGEFIGCNVERGFELQYDKSVTLRFVSGVLVETNLCETS